MKQRPHGFLSVDNIDHNGEPFDYISELHAYLWRFIRAVTPGASGVIDDHIDQAIELLEMISPLRTPEVKALVDAVQAVEWVQGDDPHNDGYDFCPWCRNWKITGHKDGCQRLAALAAFKVPE